MSNQAPTGFIEVANTSLNPVFTNQSDYDLMFYTTTSNQRILFGNYMNQPAAIGINSSNVTITSALTFSNYGNSVSLSCSNNNLTVQGGLSFLNNNVSLNGIKIQQTPLSGTPFNVTSQVTTIPNITTNVNSNVGINNGNPQYSLDVNGSVNFTGTLLQNGTIFKTSQFNTSTDGTDVYLIGSNLGVGKSNPAYPLDVVGNIGVSGQITSSVATGTAPLSVASSTLVSNLNVGLLGGQPSSYYLNNNNINAGVLAVTYGGTGCSNLTVSKVLVGNGSTSILQPANLHWDNSNMRLGVGNATPTYSLDVNGSINYTGNLLQNGSLFKGSQWTTSGSNIYITGSNIGIGKSNPAFPLDVAGSLNFTGSLLQNGSPFQGSQWITSGSNLYVSGYSNVGIGTSAPAYALDVTGGIRATGDITAFSDLKWKQNLVKIPNALEKISKINGYTFEMIQEPGVRKAGVIAQELMTVLPEVVSSDLDGNLSVAYGNVISLLIEAIKELEDKVHKLSNPIK